MRTLLKCRINCVPPSAAAILKAWRDVMRREAGVFVMIHLLVMIATNALKAMYSIKTPKTAIQPEDALRTVALKIVTITVLAMRRMKPAKPSVSVREVSKMMV